MAKLKISQLLFVVLAFSLGSAPWGLPQAYAHDHTLYDGAYVDQHGKPFDLVTGRDAKLILLNVWAEWCTPCLAEIAYLNELQDNYVNELRVVGLHFEGPKPEALGALVNKFDLRYQAITYTEPPVFGLLNERVLPVTYLLDSEGKLLKKIVGPRTLEQFTDLVKAYVN